MPKKKKKKKIVRFSEQKKKKKKTGFTQLAAANDDVVALDELLAPLAPERVIALVARGAARGVLDHRKGCAPENAAARAARKARDVVGPILRADPVLLVNRAAARSAVRRIRIGCG
jgi:(p)ppGpp synthase/HD superfamily hydrolase